MSAPDRTHTIEIRVRDVHQLFDSLDPAPFHDRDLDRDAAQYIQESLEDIPDDRPVRLLIWLPPAQLESAGMVADAVHIYFLRMQQSAERELRGIHRFGRAALLVGIASVVVILATVEALRALLGLGTLAAGLLESITIVAWVVLWRPVELLLYDWWPVRRRIRMYARLAVIPIECRAREDNAAAPAR